MARSGSLGLFYCEMRLGLWGFQYEVASGPAPPRDGGREQDTVLTGATFVPHAGKAQGTEGPNSFHNHGGRGHVIKPQTFNFCLCHLFLS